MTTKKSQADMIGRRGELMAELFLQDLNPSFVAKPTSDFGYDFYLGVQNADGGINNYAVQVKATSRPVPSRFPLNMKLFKLLTHSNIPGLLIVADVKHNKLFYAWLTREKGDVDQEGNNIVRIPVTEVNDSVKEELRKKLSG
jgi:hypothetical protein